MFDLMGKPFFASLAEAARVAIGADDHCTQALRAAGATGGHAEIGRAQVLLAALPEPQRTAIVAAAHAALRLDPAMLARARGPFGGPPPDRSRMN